jgi:hypothetical protein
VLGHVLAGGASLEDPGGAGEEAEVVGHLGGLVAGRRDRLADVPGLDLRELVGVFLDPVRELEEDLGALPRGRVETLGAWTALSASSAVLAGTSAIVSPVAGLRTSIVSPPAESTHFPPM